MQVCSRRIPISDYKGDAISSALKERIIAAGAEGKIAKENIFISEDSVVNAFATGGMRFKYIFILTGIMKILNDDQLMSVVHHEVGHVISKHIIKRVLFNSSYLLALLICVYFVYIKTAQYCNGLAAFALSEAVIISGNLLREYVSNGVCSRKFERQADFASYSRRGELESYCESEKLLALSQRGVLYHFNESWMGIVATHPSSYNRIKEARQYWRSKN